MKNLACKLTEMQENFCHEYVANNGNGKDAAIKVGASPHSASVTASKWLTREKVRNKITELKTESIRRCQIDADWITMQLKTAVTHGMSQPKEKFTVEAALKALQELAKIGGFYAPTQSISSCKNNHVVSSNHHDGAKQLLDHYEELIERHMRPA